MDKREHRWMTATAISFVGLLLTACSPPQNLSEKYTYTSSLLSATNEPSVDEAMSLAYAETNNRAQEWSLNSLLTTGSSAERNGSYWSCVTEKGLADSSELTLEFWSDLHGQVVDSPMSWTVTEADSVVISVSGRGVVRLSDIEFESITAKNDHFTAVDSLGELSTCQWRGLARSIN